MTSAPGWMRLVVTGLPDPRQGVAAVLLDPRAAVPEHTLDGWAVHAAPTAWDVRRAYEQHVRRRSSDAAPVLIHATVKSLARTDQLAWDISRLPVAVVDPRIPAPVLQALPDLPPRVAVDVCNAQQAGRPVGAVIASMLLGMALPAPDYAAELLLAARSHQVGLSPNVRSLVALAITTPEARDALGRPRPGGPLATAWADWCQRGERSPHHRAFVGCGPAILGLVDAGMLQAPQQAPAGAPAWLTPVGAAADLTPVVEGLLLEQPHDIPIDFQEWTEAATWWARIRWLCATGSVTPDVVAAAWQRWTPLDAGFREWLTSNYAAELGRGILPPRTVDKIAPYLAYQMRRTGRPQALAVMDGMGVAQWQHLRSAAAAVEAERHIVMAALPTITQVSRQAIFAGAQPTAFASTIRSPAEDRLWRTFWRAQGIPDEQIHYAPSDGRAVADIPSRARAIGIVMNNIDVAMHSAGGYDDAGFRDLVTRFAESGIVQSLIELAGQRGWDLWFTADHGNISCRGLEDRVPQQGLRVRSRGKRVWTYQTAALRDAADVPGLAWDPPGYPLEGGRPLFADGRTCYERGAVLVSHGSLSFDEVLVPLVRVET